MKRERKQYYAYGGQNGEEDGKPKRVKTVPVGYELDTDFKDTANPNRKYYRKISGSLSASKSPVKKVSSSASTSTKPRKTTYTRTTTAKPVVTPKANLAIDRVYIEDDPVAVSSPVVADQPQQALRGENTFDKNTMRAIGILRSPTRNSTGVKDPGTLLTAYQDAQFQYYEPNTANPTGEIINIPAADWNAKNPKITNFVDTSFINKYRKPVLAKTKMATGGMAGLANNAPQLLDAIVGIIDGGKPYDKQPIINPSTARAMVSPYAFGGEAGGLTEEEYAQLQAAADEQGISIEDLIAQLTQQQDDVEAGDEDSYAFGGLADINVEGREVVDIPGRQPFRVSGPKHESGGVDMTVPKGTGIYSDRLKLDGKTMADRKATRERRIAKYRKQLERDPSNLVTKSGFKRTKAIADKEEQQDMLLQTLANNIYTTPTKKYATGGVAGIDDVEIPKTGAWWETYEEPILAPVDTLDNSFYFGPSATARRDISNLQNNNAPTTDQPLTAGDYVGMAGTVFNGIAPLINSRNAARNTMPAVNRYRGFGRRAIETNQAAQNMVAGNLSDDLSNIDTSFNSAILANNNSASSVNTQRALNLAAGVKRDRARTNARQSFVNTNVGLMDRLGGLYNMQDQYEMFGQTQADQVNRDIADNYYTNHGQDLVNFGNSVSTIGANLNTAHANNVDSKLLSQLSMYGLGFDENGNLISTT